MFSKLETVILVVCSVTLSLVSRHAITFPGTREGTLTSYYGQFLPPGVGRTNTNTNTRTNTNTNTRTNTNTNTRTNTSTSTNTNKEGEGGHIDVVLLWPVLATRRGRDKHPKHKIGAMQVDFVHRNIIVLSFHPSINRTWLTLRGGTYESQMN